MSIQAEQAQTFHSLHKAGDPLILFNIWNPGSAAAVAASGARALATGSWPVAAAFGFDDGENIPLELALDNIRKIVAATDLPVSMDLEGGYGVTPNDVAETVRLAAQTGIVGFNFEDQIIGGDGLHALDIQAERIKAARRAADEVCQNLFINARTDIFLKASPDTHNEAMLEAALARADTFKKAGADGFFAPGLADKTMIKRLCAEANVPVNIIALPHVPDKQTLIDLGVSRISHGPVPYKKMSAWLADQAKAAFA